VALLATMLSAPACTAASEPDDGLDDNDAEFEIDEPRLDVGSGFRSVGADGPVGIDGGPVSLPVELSWVELEGTDVADGTVDVRLSNLKSETITVLLIVERSSGIERSTSTISTVVVQGNASTVVAIELLPADVDLGDVETSMNLRVDATAVVGDGVPVSDAAALGHYQSPTLYFHPVADTGHKVYGEATLNSTFGGGLIDAKALLSGNEVIVPDDVALEGVVVGAEG